MASAASASVVFGFKSAIVSILGAGAWAGVSEDPPYERSFCAHELIYD